MCANNMRAMSSRTISIVDESSVLYSIYFGRDAAPHISQYYFKSSSTVDQQRRASPPVDRVL